MKKTLTILLLTTGLPLAALAQPPFPYDPFGPGPFGPPQGPSTPVTLHLRRETSPEAYKAIIEVRGIEPKQVKVTTHGRMVEISTQAADRTEEEKSGERSYYRYFSYRSNSIERRFSVPRDADLAAMKREDGEGRVTLIIPRRSLR